jgi:NitT/TauT family transport system substrate-binding protein
MTSPIFLAPGGAGSVLRATARALCHGRHRPRLLLALLLPLAVCLPLLPAGCSDDSGGSAKSDNKLTVSYLGLTCEVPIFTAYEQGFFKDEGLEATLVKSDWDTLRDGLGLGKFDATHHLTMFLLKPIEQGLDIRLTGGIHTGCLRLQAGVKTDVRKPEDLKGKRVAISSMGNPPFMFASRVFGLKGLDASKDVEWVVYPNDAMELALEQGKVDAVASAEPIGTILLAHNKVRTIADQATDPPYNEEYCCVTVVSGKLARNDPAKAAQATRAMLRGAKWVNTNQTAAAKMAVEKGYVAASAELNAQAISKLDYAPGVSRAKRDLLSAAQDMKKVGFLNKDTDPEELIKRAWLDLDGVTDDWVKGLQVEKVAGGGRPPALSDTAFAAFFNDARTCRDFRFCSCDW